MENKVYIFHSKELIRKGLYFIIKEELNFDCEILEDINDLNDNDFHNHKTILITDMTGYRENMIISDLLKENKLSVIKIVSDYYSESLESVNFDKILNEDISAEQIKELLYKSFNTKAPLQSKRAELSKREKEILINVAKGLSNKEIAEKLFISIHTVVTHRKNITEKLGIRTISGLTVYAMINGYIDINSINREDLI